MNLDNYVVTVNGLPVEDTLELHFPSYNYMGPGTHVLNRVAKHVQPINQTDAAAMVHDINYILANGDATDLTKADNIANNMSSGLPGLLMEAGLGIRKLLNLYVGTTYHPKLLEYALEAKKQILTSDAYSSFNIKPQFFIK